MLYVYTNYFISPLKLIEMKNTITKKNNTFVHLPNIMITKATIRILRSQVSQPFFQTFFSDAICILCINKFNQIEATYSLKHLIKVCLAKRQNMHYALYMGFRRIFRRKTRKNISFLFKYLD